MRAMVLAAGLGSRLGEMGLKRAKCLFEAGGKTMLEHVVLRLKAAGVTEVVINLHHMGQQIRDYLKKKENFGLDIFFSVEDELLDTGGGILNARSLLEEQKEFIIYNADIYCDYDLNGLIAKHQSEKALATLAVSCLDDPRHLLFTPEGLLAGWGNQATAKAKTVVKADRYERYNFCGFYVLSPAIFDFMPQDRKVFSIIDTLLEGAKAGRKISACKVKDAFWADIGTPERLSALQQALQPQTMV